MKNDVIYQITAFNAKGKIVGRESLSHKVNPDDWMKNRNDEMREWLDGDDPEQMAAKSIISEISPLPYYFKDYCETYLKFAYEFLSDRNKLNVT